MSDFNPDAFLAETGSAFNPDTFLAETGPQEVPADTSSSILKKTGEVLKKGGLAALHALDWVSHIGQPQAAKDLVQRIQSSPADAPQNPQQAAQVPSWAEAMGSVMPGQAMPTLPPGADYRPAVAATVDAATSPMTYATLGISAASKVPVLAAAMRAAGRAPEAGATALASKLTRIPGEALSAASTPTGRAGLAAAAQGAGGRGARLADALVNFEKNMPEAAVVEDAIAKMPKVSLENTIDVLRASKVPEREGVRLLPHEIAANKKIDTYIESLLGDNPSAAQVAAADLAGGATQAGKSAAEKSARAGALRSAAENEGAYAKSGSKTASDQIGTAERLASKQQGERGFYSWENPETVANAKVAAERAQESAITADARAAAGSIAKEDAEAAQHVADLAAKRHAIADAAYQLSQGKSLEEVGASLIKSHGLKGEALKDALAAARERSSVKVAPVNHDISPQSFRAIRKGLDVNIDFSDESAGIVNKALKSARLQMKNDLLASASSQEYADAMKAWSDKLDLAQEVKSLIGKEEGARQDIRASSMLKTAAKEAKGGPRRALLERFDKAAGQKFLEEADIEKQALEFGPEGRPSWMPNVSPLTGLGELAAGAGFGHYSGHPLLAALASAGAVAGSSPAIAARGLIPASRIPPYLLRAASRISPEAVAAGEIPSIYRRGGQ